MKKIILTVIALFLVTSTLFGCQTQVNNNPPGESTQLQTEPADPPATKTPDTEGPDSPDSIDLDQWILSDTASVETEKGQYRVSAYYQTEATYGRVCRFLLTYAPDGSPENVSYRTYEPESEYDWENTVKPVLFFDDLTFDGNSDILMAEHESGYGGFGYIAFVWESETESFELAKGFCFPTYTLDTENRCILNSTVQSQIWSFQIIRYNEADRSFRAERSLYGEPVDYTGKNRDMEVSEDTIKNGVPHEVKRFTVPYDAWIGNEENALMAEYFAPGSTWDLGSDRWNFGDRFAKRFERIREKNSVAES